MIRVLPCMELNDSNSFSETISSIFNNSMSDKIVMAVINNTLRFQSLFYK
jgi:hypothetical protein